MSLLGRTIESHRPSGEMIQGEENISSAMLSSDGKTLAVATIAEVKLFSLRCRCRCWGEQLKAIGRRGKWSQGEHLHRKAP
jgi:hypothetical protein